jgi:hypothetical protein
MNLIKTGETVVAIGEAVAPETAAAAERAAEKLLGSTGLNALTAAGDEGVRVTPTLEEEARELLGHWTTTAGAGAKRMVDGTERAMASNIPEAKLDFEPYGDSFKTPEDGYPTPLPLDADSGLGKIDFKRHLERMREDVWPT